MKRAPAVGKLGVVKTTSATKSGARYGLYHRCVCDCAWDGFW